MKRWLQIGNVLFIVVYLLCAAVQYNDPDALAWIALYLAAAACTGMSLAAIPPTNVARILAIFALAYALWLIPGFYGKVSAPELLDALTMRTQHVEVAREAGGALLVAAWMCVLGFYPHNTEAE